MTKKEHRVFSQAPSKETKKIEERKTAEKCVCIESEMSRVDHFVIVVKGEQ